VRHASFRSLVAVVAAGDLPGTLALATLRADEEFLDPGIRMQIYRGDTALHVAAACDRTRLVQALLDAGADVRARNRLGYQPLHAAATGGPGAPTWNPSAQAETIALLIARGADPNAVCKRGVTPLHRAVRCRCAAAAAKLLELGADPARPNGNGSMPIDLARSTTGRGGSGEPAAKEQQALIVEMLRR